MDNLELEEVCISTRPVFHGKILNLRVDTVQLPNGKTATREVVEHARAVTILAITESNEVVLTRQFRYPVGEELWELPAGKVDPGEDPVDCARRELLEETGYSADELRRVLTFYTTPGFSDELMDLYVAQGLKKGVAKPDEDEFITSCAVKPEAAQEMIRKGEIRDAKTLVGLLFFFCRCCGGAGSLS